jgi:transposase
MLLRPFPLPPVPRDTARSAKTMFGEGNAYIRLGKHINELFPPTGQLIHETPCEKPAWINILPILVVLQFAEELTDRQMLEALRTRVDLKYALHLPMNYPAPPPNVLCECRQQLRADSARRQAFQILLDGIAGFGLLRSDRQRPSSALEVIDEVCTSNRLDMVAEAMLQALEGMATTNAEWLRQIARPHWYMRYSRHTNMHLWPNNREKWEAGVLAVGVDIHYLLAEIEKSKLPTLTSISEVQRLRQVWEEQFIADVNNEPHTQGMR